jgi:hypothetical protein
MIPELETEPMWLRPARLEDAEHTQKLFPQWEIVKYLGAVVPWPYRIITLTVFMLVSPEIKYSAVRKKKRPIFRKRQQAW